MDKMPKIGHSYCLQCSSPHRIDWTSIEFFDTYSDALSAMFIAQKVFKSLPYRIVHFNLEICD